MYPGEQPLDGSVEALRSLLETDSARRVVETMRRQAEGRPSADLFNLEQLLAIESDSEAGIWLRNLGRAVESHDKRTALLRERFSDARRRGLSLVDTSFGFLEQAIGDTDIGALPHIYGKVYTQEEVRAISEQIESNRDAVDRRVADDAGIDTSRLSLFSPSHAFKGAEKMYRMLRGGEVHTDYPLVQSSNLIYFAADMTNSAAFNNRLVGVGDYGGDHTVSLIRALGISANAVMACLPIFADWEKTVGQDEVAKLVRAAMPMDTKGEDGEGQPASSLTAYEGLLTVFQSIAMLTSQYRDEYVDPDLLLDDIINNGLVGRLARKIPYSGIIGPMSLSGTHFSEPLSGAGEALSLSPELELSLAQTRRSSRDYILLSYENLEHGKQLKHFGLNGCPVAHSLPRQSTLNNGVDKYAKLFQQAYKIAAKIKA